MISPEKAKDWVGRAARIRVHAAAVGLQDHVMAEGRVIAYGDGPMVGIEHEGGERSWWLCSLPIVEIEGGGNPDQLIYDRAERIRQLVAAVDHTLAVMGATGAGWSERHQALVHLRAVRDRTQL